MDSNRIKEIQLETAYPDSISVQQALMKVWNECEQDSQKYTFFDYQKMFHQLYSEVAQMLCLNKVEKNTPNELLSKWDTLRQKYNVVNI